MADWAVISSQGQGIWRYFFLLLLFEELGAVFLSAFLEVGGQCQLDKPLGLKVFSLLSLREIKRFFRLDRTGCLLGLKSRADIRDLKSLVY